MRRLLSASILALALFWLSATLLQGQTFPAPKGFVNDFAYLISNSAESDLESLLYTLEEDTSAELAVVTVNSLEGDSVEDYAVNLFQAWGIGKKDKDNGVLFLVAVTDRKTRIEVGYGLESIITDGRAGRILDSEVLPSFRSGDYEEGIVNGVQALEVYIREGTPPDLLEENPLSRFFSNFSLPSPLLIGLGIVSIYVFGFMARSKSIWLGGIWGLISGIILGFNFGQLWLMITLPIGLAILGTVLDIILSANYRERSSGGHSTGWFSSGGGFSGSGGGFGGFGGGHSGGGGASRGW